MNDIYLSAELQSLHTLQRRLRKDRRTEAHPYEAVIKGLSSLRADTARRRRLLYCLHRRPV